MRSQGYAARAHASFGGRSRPHTATADPRLKVRRRPPAPHAPRRAARRAGLRPMRRARVRWHDPASLLRYGRLLGRWLGLRRNAPLARGSRGFGGELIRPLFGGEGLGELFEVAAEGGLEVVG